MTRVSGGLIDRSRTLDFSFDGQSFTGHPGDTLASALLANGVRLMGRSFKYHRPRGLVGAGSEEPNALVEVGSDAWQEPNTRATVLELAQGLNARSQNYKGSLRFDWLAVNDLMSPFLVAGFYYKTFMWPKRFWEQLYEPAIRAAAGLGRLSMLPDPDRYDKGFLHCDLLIVGAGAAGLAAALTAGRAGARVILADEDFRLGGRLIAESHTLDEKAPTEWVSEVEAELGALPNVRLMRRTTVWGAFDHGVFGTVERAPAGLSKDDVSQTLWRITAKRTILAAGATERHIPFKNNDRPGIMLASAIRTYANRWAVAPGKRAAVFTNNDDGHRTAIDLLAKGIEVVGVVDSRDGAKAKGNYPLFAGAHVSDTRGRLGLQRIAVTKAGKTTWLEADALGVSGGWNPNVHLASHHRGRPAWDEALQAFLPPAEGGPPGLSAAGAASGQFTTQGALLHGARMAVAILEELGYNASLPPLPACEDEPIKPQPIWHVPGKGRAWIDFQNDVTVKDVVLSYKENMRPVEHLKRWTTLGMATDQGKTSNVTALAVMAELTGNSITATGTTIYRPPYSGVPIGVLGGGDTGPHFRPRRLTPTHTWAKSRGAVFVEVGQWMRAQYFPRSGETTWRETVDREVLSVRTQVGVCDVTTLGKIDVQGRDAGAFLDRVYCNNILSLKRGFVRYGVMLREDGMVFDDGTCARLGDSHYVVTTTTAQAAAVYRHLEFARQCLWPELDVHLISTTEAWAQLSIAGPHARSLLERIVDGFDLSNEVFPFMSCAELTICNGLRARLFRISFSGELAYELAVPARFGNALMGRLIERGADLGATPYGTETLGVLRIEKGHPAGNELNGQTTAQMLGLSRMVSTKKASIGSVMAQRVGLCAENRILVGLKPVKDTDPVVSGSHLFSQGARPNTANDEGWITSACYSRHLGSAIGLGFLADGAARIGQIVIAENPLEGQSIPLLVVSPHFIDPEGQRLRD